MKNFPKIDLNRLKKTFEISSGIGKTEGGGLNRLALTDEDRRMRDTFIEWLKKAKLEVRVDDLGNIYGRREGKNNDAGSILIGSHLDTQPKGGRFDGIMGVLCGLEVIRTLNDYDIVTERPVEVMNITAEEGTRFGLSMGSSGVLSGVYRKEDVYALRDQDGITFEQSLDTIGYKGDFKNRAGNVAYYIEPHIEQGPMLELNKKSIGVVDGIEGVTKYKVVVNGKSMHSAHPSFGRRDALLAASEMVLNIDKLNERFDNLSSVVDVFFAYPSVLVISVGRVEFCFDIRTYSDEDREKAGEWAKQQLKDIAARRKVEVSCDPFWSVDSTNFSTEITNLVQEGAEQLGYSYQRMVSRSGHDATYMNRVMRSGMIFAPSVKGLSHCEDELTSYEDIEKTANVLMYVVSQLANK